MTETPQPGTAGRRRLVVVLLLLVAGGAGGTLTAVLLRDERGARPAAGGDQSGTGTVLGGTDPAPDGSGTATDGVFFIAGRANGLAPGRPQTLALTVTNPNPWPIQVLTLDTDVAGPAGASCPAETLDVARYEYAGGTRHTAPSLGTVEVPVRIELADSLTADQSGCAGATFPLTMTGTAVRAR